MLERAALIPSAPLLLSRVTPCLPPELEGTRAAVRTALAGVSDADVVVLLAAGATTGAHASARASLTGAGRPDVTADLPVPARALREIAGAAGLERAKGPLPLDMAVLALHLDRAVLPVGVAADADAPSLTALGGALAASARESGLRVAMVAAGDGSAGLGERAPRAAIAGAPAWQEAFASAVGDPRELAGLGPAEAGRVVARGWAPAVALAAACEEAGLRTRVSERAAPRGVGYLVAEVA